MSELVAAFEDYLRRLDAEPAAPPLSSHDLQVATTVLLVQVLRADLDVQQEEVEVLLGALETVLGLPHQDARELMRLAAEHARSGASLYRSVKLLDQHLTRQQRVHLVEWLWRVAFADAQLLAHEEYLVRKVAELLCLTTADLVEAKVRAKEAFS
jgi:uncharacterized tellurite resistance protein B-like protein